MSKKLEIPDEFVVRWAEQAGVSYRFKTVPDTVRGVMAVRQNADACRAAYRQHLARERRNETMQKVIRGEAVTPVQVNVVGFPSLNVELWGDVGLHIDRPGTPPRYLLIEPDEILRLADCIRGDGKKD